MRYQSFYAFLVFALLSAGCASTIQPSVSQVEEIVTDNSLQQELRPSSTLPSGLGIEPIPLSDDLSVLEESYGMFRIEESSGDNDYYLWWDGSTLGTETIKSQHAIASERERDNVVQMKFGAPTIIVRMDGSHWMGWSITLYSSGPEKLAIRNGVIVEVAGESFLVKETGLEPGMTFLTDRTPDYENGVVLLRSDDENSAELFRMFKLMAQNPYTARVIDQKAVEHVFVFDSDFESLSVMPVQKVLTHAFNAVKYIELGYGY